MLTGEGSLWVVLFCALWTRAAKGVQLGAEAKLDFWGRNRGAFSGWRRLDRLEKHAHTGSTDKIPGRFRPSQFTVCGLGWVFVAERSAVSQHTNTPTFSPSRAPLSSPSNLLNLVRRHQQYTLVAAVLYLSTSLWTSPHSKRRSTTFRSDHDQAASFRGHFSLSD